MKRRSKASWFALALVLSWAGAQPQALGGSSQAKSDWERLLGQRSHIKLFFQEMIRRDLARELALAMRANGFSEEEIQGIPSNPSFRDFSRRVIEAQEVDQALEAGLTQMLDQDSLESSWKKWLREREEQIRQEKIMALLELARAKKMRKSQDSLSSQEGFWVGLWHKLAGGLLD